MDFSVPFEFVRVGGLDFLCYRSRSTKQKLGGIAVFVEESVQSDGCFVVLNYEWAEYLPVLAHFRIMHNGSDEDGEFEDDDFTGVSSVKCALCGCFLSSENRSEVVNLCLNCFDNLMF